MVEVRKKPKETTPSLVRRFSSKLRMSGTLIEARKRQYTKRPLSPTAKKQKALRRIRKRSED
jgi:ribosomal protein S21